MNDLLCCFKTYFIFFLATIHYLFANGQEITIEVLDSLTLEPISQVSLQIELLNSDDKTIKRSFFFTDDVGQTEGILVSNEVEFLEISLNHIRYRPKTLRISSQQLESINKILLIPQSYQIPEITVTPEYGHRSTSYVVDSFRTVRTLRMRELIENIPELTMVSGKLHYQNKEVESLLLDSIDVFGNEYGMLINNLPTRFIESLDVLENFQENKQLEDFEKGSLAVNINTKDGKELMLGGGVSLTANHAEVLNAEGDASLIDKKGFAFFVDANFNQWGEYPHSNDFLNEGSMSYSYGAFQNVQGEFSIGNNRNQVDPRYLFDNNFFGSKLNASWHLSQDWNAVFSIHQGSDESSISQQVDFEQDLGDAEWSYSKETTQEYENNVNYVDFNLTGDKEEGYHKFMFNGALFSGFSAERVKISGDLVDSFLTEGQLDPQRRLAFHYEFTKSINEKTVGILTAQGGFEKKNENWTTTSSRLKDLFQLSDLDTVQLRRQHANLNLNYKWIVKNLSSRWNFEMDLRRQFLDWETRYLKGEEFIEELNSDNIWLAYDSRAKIQYRNHLPGFQKNSISISFEGGAVFYRNGSKDEKLESTFPFKSRVQYRYRNTNDRTFSSSVEYDQDTPDPSYFVRNNLALPSFALVSGLSGLDLIKKATVNFGFNSRQLFTLWDYGMQGYYTHFWSKISTQQTVRIENTLSDRYFDEAQTAMVRGDIKRYFSVLPLNIQAAAQITYNDFYQILNGERRRFRNQMVSLSMKPQFTWKLIELDLESGLRQSLFIVQKGETRFQNLNTVNDLQLKFMSSNQIWEFSTSANYTYNFSNGFDLMIWDAVFSYNFRFGKLKVIFHNLLDQNLIDRRVNEISEYQLVQPLIGRYVALRLDIVI